MRVLYDFAADLTALLHFGFLAFVVLGALLGRRSGQWRVIHLAAMAYGVLVEVFYWYCPLTYLEQFLRKRSGRGFYEEPFIAHYLNRIIYLEVPQWSLIVAALLVLTGNLWLYAYWAYRSKGTGPSAQG